MARTPKQGGLVALCAKHGINQEQLASYLGQELANRTLWDWTKLKPSALEALIIGVARQLGIVELTDEDGCAHYVEMRDLEKFVTGKIGDGWQISNEAIWAANDLRAFSIKHLGTNPTLVL